jgi:peptide/nickel transport system substrate-binding protein
LRLRLILLVAAAFALLAPSCGGGGESAGAKTKILRIGTTYYVDTFNPLIGIETQDSTADEMVYPQLLQYGPGT